MYKQITTSLTNGTKVVQVLLQRFGAQMLFQVEQESEDVFTARLRDGRMFRAEVQADGRLSVQEMEGVA